MDSTKPATSNQKGSSIDNPTMAKKAKKNSDTVNYIWLVKTFHIRGRWRTGHENLIGAFSSKESAIQNAKVTMEDLEEEEYKVEDNSGTVDDDGVVFSSSSDAGELFEVSIKKISLDKPITHATFSFL